MANPIKPVGKIKFQTQIDVNGLSKANSYQYGKESKINYRKLKPTEIKKMEEDNQDKKNDGKVKKEATIFDIIDIDD